MIGLVLLGASWWLSVAGAASPARHKRVVASAPAPSASLLRQLQQRLARPAVPRVLRAPRDRLPPNGGTCAVAAGGFCSLTPCVVYTWSGSGTVSTTIDGPIVLQRAVPAPNLRALTPPGGASCQGRPAPPRTLQVSGA